MARHDAQLFKGDILEQELGTNMDRGRRHYNGRRWEQLASGAQEGWLLLPIRQCLPID